MCDFYFQMFSDARASSEENRASRSRRLYSGQVQVIKNDVQRDIAQLGKFN